MSKRSTLHVSLIVLLALMLGFFDLPYTRQKNVLPATPKKLENQKIHLGLDLQGGSQLDYKIDLRRVEEVDREQIIEGVLEVINKRVNALGVSEPNIYRSQIADEEHIVVELAGIKDLEEAKETVGKTIQLEFKEENPDKERNAEEIEAVQKMAQATLDRIQKGESLQIVAEEEMKAYPAKINYVKGDAESYTLKSNLPAEFFPALDDAAPGSVIPQLIQANDGYTMDGSGNLAPLQGFFIVKLNDRREGVNKKHEDKEVKASHVLIAYKGSERAAETITRTKEEAKILADEVRAKASAGQDFAELAKTYSDEPAAANSGGDLGFFGPGQMTKAFEDAAFAMEVNQISEIVETEFGFHIIKVTEIKPEVNESVPEMEYNVEKLLYSTAPDPWKETQLTGEHFKRADVAFTPSYTPYVSIEFTEEGGKLFEELTGRNVNKRIAIFVGGQLISAPNVNEKISGGQAQISGNFDIESASTLARDLNTGAIPAPITLVGQYTIGASLGQDALNSSIKAGLLGLIVLALFMLLYYRMLGALAIVALSIYSLALIFFIKVSMPMGIAITISLLVFCFNVSAILKNKDSGWEKLISFALACFVLFFLAYMLATPIVLTLAGVAGVVLSIGMAVDANILIFERMREELRNKRSLSEAIEIGFDRAWSSIRDSNFSSLITTGILMYFGSSIIKGFAVNLALGILISMFTAITITRTFLRAIAKTKWASNDFLLGTPKKPHLDLKIIPNRNVWFAASGGLAVIALIAILSFGFKLGMDFTGGTLMEIQFNKPVTSQEVIDTLKIIENNLVTKTPTSESNPIESPDSTAPTLSTPEENKPIPINFGQPVVVSSGENTMIIRMKHISNETHDEILRVFKNQWGELEETRYTTIGATIGETMKQKAVTAIAIASIMIVLYIAFAFRKVPKEVSAWRFGVTAIVALLHDVLITIGLFVILGKTLGVEIDALFITAVLTVMGFSVHDTIVVFDRIRENLRLQKRGESFEDIANLAVNQTLGRSINTSLSALFTITALFLFGAESVHYFLLALIFGFVAGTYSSIFIASPLLVSWHKWKNK